MTVIIGLEHEDKVYMGCDSFFGNWNRNITIETKVFKREDMIFGICGSARLKNLLMYDLTVDGERKESEDKDRYMSTVFSDAIRKCFDDKNFMKKVEGRDRGAMFLVGYQGRLYRVQRDFDVTRAALGYDGVGAGMTHAISAMYAITNLESDLEPEKMVELGLEAACFHSPYCCKPITVDMV